MVVRFGLRAGTPGAWWSGLLVAERFAAPAGTCVVRLPLGSLAAVGENVLLTITMIAGDRGWRSMVVRRSELAGDFGAFAFAGLGDGAGLGVLISTGEAWRVPSAVQVRAAWVWLRQAEPIAVACGGAVAGSAEVRIAPGPVWAMHLVEAGEEVVPGSAPEEEAEVAVLRVERFWREGGGCYLQGWFHAYGTEVRSARFLQDEGPPVRVEALAPRTDLLSHYPMLPQGALAGFTIHLPRQAGSTLRLALELAGGETAEVGVMLAGQEGDGHFAWGDPAALQERAAAAWERFRRATIDGRLEVLEIGARVVAMGSTDLRQSFAGAGRYAGMDIHPSPGLDVVGDVHALSALVGAGAFDAMFSSAVLEHLAMPWLAAAEMNRALRPGGLVFHRTHQCWPVHERPNDFFRFSDDALRSLFGPAFGFEVLDAGMALPMMAYARDKSDPLFNQTPLNPAFGMSWVLARKVAEAPAGGGADTAALAALSRQYPAPAG